MERFARWPITIVGFSISFFKISQLFTILIQCIRLIEVSIHFMSIRQLYGCVCQSDDLLCAFYSAVSLSNKDDIIWLTGWCFVRNQWNIINALQHIIYVYINIYSWRHCIVDGFYINCFKLLVFAREIIRTFKHSQDTHRVFRFSFASIVVLLFSLAAFCCINHFCC